MITSRLFQSSLSVRSACQASLCLGKSYLQLQHSFSVIIMIFLITIIIVIISIVIMDIVFIIIIITKTGISWNTFIQSDRLQKCPASALASARYFLEQLKIVSLLLISHFSSSIFSHSSNCFSFLFSHTAQNGFSFLLLHQLMNSLNTNDMRNERY